MRECTKYSKQKRCPCRSPWGQREKASGVEGKVTLGASFVGKESSAELRRRLDILGRKSGMCRGMGVKQQTGSEKM